MNQYTQKPKNNSNKYWNIKYNNIYFIFYCR